MARVEIFSELERLTADEEELRRQIFDRETKIGEIRAQITSLLKSLQSHFEKEGIEIKDVAVATQYERIVKFFQSRAHGPQTTMDIADATGISRPSLSQILYRTHRDKFMRVTDPEGRKLWALTEAAIKEASRDPADGVVSKKDLFGIDAADCCYRILKDHGNEPMSVLTMTREALRRGYRARTTGNPDAVLFSTSKSFWARLGRDERFEMVQPFVYRLRETEDTNPEPQTKNFEDWFEIWGRE